MTETEKTAMATDTRTETDLRLFTTTQWGVVLAAAKTESPEKYVALEHLCRTYRHPVYLFVRRRGHDSHQAEDLTQAFFARLLQKDAVKSIKREKGKFRTFLLTSLTNFLANEWDKEQALKRGGQHTIVSLDDTSVDEAYLSDNQPSLSPDKLFDGRWAQTLMEQTLADLKKEYAAGGKDSLFQILEPGLTNKVTAATDAQWAAELGLSNSAVKVALHRLRRRFGELLRSAVAQTVSRPEEIDEEIRYLFAVLCQ
jgi:RNA polymerase sigma-70 factor (ECF subfamily)